MKPLQKSLCVLCAIIHRRRISVSSGDTGCSLTVFANWFCVFLLSVGEWMCCTPRSFSLGPSGVYTYKQGKQKEHDSKLAPREQLSLWSRWWCYTYSRRLTQSNMLPRVKSTCCKPRWPVEKMYPHPVYNHTQSIKKILKYCVLYYVV